MSEITVTSGTIENYAASDPTLKLRVYLRKGFTPSTGEALIKSRIGSPNFYQEIDCTVAGGIVTYDSFVIDSTTDALSNPDDASYTFVLYTPGGTKRAIIYKNIKVPHTTTPTTLGDLAAYNAVDAIGASDLYYTKVEADAIFAEDAEGVTNGDAHDHLGGDGAQIAHSSLSGIGTNTHAQIDTHIANVANPHVVTKAQVGLGNADNTSDANKPISTATQTALDTLDSTIDTHIADVANPHVVTKTQVGLGNADNTSDANKPISTATQTALDLKADDSAVVHDTGNETIAGIKTFLSSPIVPTPTTNFQPATKKYVDDFILAGNTVDSVNGQIGTVVLDAGDIDPVTNRNYVTDAQAVVIGNTSGANTGDEVKATGAEVNTGTDDDKYVTPKAIADSNVAFLSDISAAISDAAYVEGTWDGDGTHAPSKNAVRDIVQTILGLIAGSALADGDYGDITVSSGGTVFTIDTGLDAAKIADGSISNAEFQRLNGVTGDIQGQIDGKQATLVSATNIKTVNGNSLLGAGDIPLTGLSFAIAQGAFFR